MENYLIAGLGNPGADYALTRHNVGFGVTGLLAERWKAAFRQESGFQARIAFVDYGESKVCLCQPLTWMNLSGKAVGALTRYYKIKAENILVVLDDADLPLGKVRMRPGGSSGGHRGMESVILHLGTEDIPRLKIGIGDAGQRRITRHVLGRFGEEELPVMEKVLSRAADQAQCWIAHGIQKAMNEFNGAVAPEKRENE
jgi:PTH1 family peptidyl-tRNA hydrolase